MPSPADQPNQLAVVLSSAARGDRRAFAELYEATSPQILGSIRRIVIDSAQSEEVAQEVYLEIWQHCSRYDPNKGNALGWMRAIARRRAIDRVRSSESDRARDHKIGHRHIEVPFDVVSEAVETRMDFEQTRRALSTLNATHQAVIDKVIIRGLSHREAGLELDVPLGTIKSRLHEALKRLREASGNRLE